MRHTILVLVAVGIAALSCTGCQESESKMVRKARVVGNENLQLKKQLAEKDEQIEALKKEIEKIQAESAEQLEKAGDASIKSLRLLLESEKANETLRKEVEQLKANIEKLKAQ